MHISTTKIELQKAFSKLIKTSQVKTQTPLINYTYISAGAHGVVLHSTDMEVGIKTTIIASVNAEGEGLFPTSEVNDIIAVIDEGRIDIEVAGPHINIKSEKGTSFDIPTLPFQEYPSIPENRHEEIYNIKTKDLKIILDSIIYAINKDQLKPALSGALFSFSNEEVNFVSTDGHRLVIIKAINDSNLSEDFIIPKKYLNMLNSFIKGQEESSLTFSNGHIFINNESDVLYSRLIDEKYPNYNAVIPQNNDQILQVKKEDLLNSIKATSIATNKNTNQISLNLSKGEVYLKSVNQPESKTVHAPLKSAEYNGEDISIGFNLTYLKEAISNYPSDKVNFTFKDNLSATLLLPKTNENNITILLMPVRINE
tara:strand:+ start:624 stop:1730 length:1107 start_codon:yes stop_codon:yes gene_type:complete